MRWQSISKGSGCMCARLELRGCIRCSGVGARQHIVSISCSECTEGGVNKELKKNAACDLGTSLKGYRVTMGLNRVTSHLSCTKKHSIDTVNRVLLYIQAIGSRHMPEIGQRQLRPGQSDILVFRWAAAFIKCTEWLGVAAREGGLCGGCTYRVQPIFCDN